MRHNIVINFIETGKAYSDFECENFLTEQWEKYKGTSSGIKVETSTENIVLAAIALCKRGTIKSEKIQFQKNGITIPHTNQGGVPKLPDNTFPQIYSKWLAEAN